MEVIDNFLSPSYFKELESVITDSSFMWASATNITDSADTNIQGVGFSRAIYKENSFVNNPFSFICAGLLFQILDTVNCKRILRSRVDMTTYQAQKFLHKPHIDIQDPYIPNITTIFYITNNVESETIIYDKKVKSSEGIDADNLTILKKVAPRKNRLIYFDGDFLHTGHSPIHENRRILINSNFCYG